MQPIIVKEHSLRGWSDYAKQIGFVPDPMVLRTGQVFLNGLSGAANLERKDLVVWNVLAENLAGLLDFFDILVTRDTIPLINYYETFLSLTNAPLEQLLPGFACPIHIDYSVYDTVKKGALRSLAQVDLERLRAFGQQVVNEMNTIRYDWKPDFGVLNGGDELNAISNKFRALDPLVQAAAQFLLGSFIFGGYAQASRSTHYMQPKRSRFFLGLVTPPSQGLGFSKDDEDAIFKAAAERLKEDKADFHNTEAIPPVLPYLLAQGEPANVRVLLDRALKFRESAEGRSFRKVVDDIRADGIQGRRAEDAVRAERQKAAAFLDPYSKLAADRSYSMEMRLSAKVALPFAEIKAEAPVPLRVPTRLLLWWNDQVPFGSVHKTLRRMWLAADSYHDLAKKLQQVWVNS